MATLITTRGLGRGGGLLASSGLGTLTPAAAATGVRILLARLEDAWAANLADTSPDARLILDRAAHLSAEIRESATVWDVPDADLPPPVQMGSLVGAHAELVALQHFVRLALGHGAVLVASGYSASLAHVTVESELDA